MMAVCTMIAGASFSSCSGRAFPGMTNFALSASSTRFFQMSALDHRSKKKDYSEFSHPPPKSVITPRVGIIGGTGFIGQRLVRRLYDLGYIVKIIARRPYKLKKHLAKDHVTVVEGFRPLEKRTLPVLTGDIAQKVATAGILDVENLHTEYLKNLDTLHVELCRASIRRGNIQRALADCDSIINLVGILHESRKGGSFQDVHVDSAARVAACAEKASIKRLIHISAIGASEESSSAYARSKAAGEKAVLHYCPTATILRPSVVVGPGDGFFNFFNRMSLVSPFLPLVEEGKTRFQPVHVDDLVEAIALALVNEEARGKTYEVGGPEVFTFKELLRKFLQYRHRRRFLLPLPTAAAKAFAGVSEYLPFTPLLTRDQIKQLEKDNVVSSDANTLEDLGIGDLLSVDEALKDMFIE